MRPELTVDTTVSLEKTASKEIAITDAAMWLVSLFERHHYAPIPAHLIKKLAHQAHIGRHPLREARKRLLITLQRTSKPSVKWFWLLPTPTERLILSSKGTQKIKVKKDEASDLLIGLLISGPQPFQVIWDKIRKLGISLITLRRVKRDLHVESIRTTDGWFWRLTD